MGRRDDIDPVSHSESRSDGDLLAAARDDPEAFAAFYDRHVEAVLVFFRRRVGGVDVALDLTAETFAGALGAVAGYTPSEAPVRAWLFAIARHKLSDAIRRGQVDDLARRALAMEPVELDDEALKLADELASSPVLELLDALPAEQREAIAARHLDEREYTEIAADLRCSESVIRKRVSRGLAALRSELERR
jgi:RNA polymerase sigma-70 factor (ECF subfamily)